MILVSLAYYIFSAYCTWSFFKKKRSQPHEPNQKFPPVSIIKPVAGAEAGYLDNFISFCTQDYPEYEIFFAVAQQDDPVLPILEKLKQRLPDKNIKWVISNHNQGPNYKVGNLIAAINRAEHNILVMSDSDMRVGPSYLREVVSTFLREKAGIVTCLYRGVNIHNIPSALEALTIQADFIPNVLLDHRLEGISYGFGATLCTSKEILSSVNDFESLRQYLADDYQIANRIHKQGYRVVLCPYLIDHVSAMKRFKNYFLHQLRWAITQRVSRPVGYIASFITHGVSLSLLLLVLEGGSWEATAIFAVVLGVRYSSLAYLNHSIVSNREIVRYFWLVPVKDVTQTVIWLVSLFSSTVRWRNRRFRVLKNGKMIEL